MFCDRAHVASVIAGKSVAVVGSGPSVLLNQKRYIDTFDVVVRINNHKIIKPQTGARTDIHYSYFGRAVRKKAADLIREGVKLCMCKCPDTQFTESAWHRQNDKMNGVDFRYIYEFRRSWWFCPTYVPTLDEFLAKFALLDCHVPTTGFAALLDVLAFSPSSVYMTGFDFFASGVHNVNERWRPGNPEDPIGHRPDLERKWLQANLAQFPITLDRSATDALTGKKPKRDPYSRRIY